MLEHFVAELPVSESAGELQCADQQGEEAERGRQRRLGIVRGQAEAISSAMAGLVVTVAVVLAPAEVA